MSIEEVILVNEKDRETGTMEKLEAHRKGFLHRAFSVFIVNSSGRLLLQKRAHSKYHSPGLWTNTCCSHPRPGESVYNAALRRLQEEMGMNSELKEVFSFVYRADFDNGLTEHEYDHVLVGVSDIRPVPDDNEVESYEYVDLEYLAGDLEANHSSYTVWFRLAFPRVKDELASLVD